MSKRYRRARRYYKKIRARARKMTFPIAPVIGIMSAPAVQGAIVTASQGNIGGTISWLRNVVGVDANGSFQPSLLYQNLTPMVAGLLVHKAANMLGINRTLASAKIPFLRV